MTDITKVLDKIKQKGFWRIVIRPTKFKPDLIDSSSSCEELIRNAQVELRGWPYPYYEINDKVERGQDWIQTAVDFESHIELWRMYLSGQFIHYSSLREDWMDYQRMANEDSRFSSISQGDILGLDLMVYNLTEIFEFISRIAKQGLYPDGLRVIIELNNTAKRRLFIFDFSRAGFFTSYKTDTDTLTYSKEMDEETALQNSKQNALQAILFFTDRFGWDKPNETSIKDMQQKLLERRL